MIPNKSVDAFLKYRAITNSFSSSGHYCNLGIQSRDLESQDHAPLYQSRNPGIWREAVQRQRTITFKL